MGNLIEFKEFSDQIKKLEEKKLIINDYDFAIQKLKSCNYYNIINGYKKIFLDESIQKETFKNDTNFEEIYALYEFDRNIRNIFLAAAILIENTFKTQVSYVFAKYHNSLNYLQYSNFETFENLPYSNTTISRQATKIHKLLSKINSEISKYMSKHDYIKHHIVKNGYIPFWVLINSLSLGTVSNFYELMNQSERVEISKYWGIKESELRNFIINIAFYRNLCAHDKRLFCSKCNNIINDTKLHTRLNVQRNSNGYICGKDDLFSLLISLKYLMNADDFKNTFNKLRGEIERLSNKTTSENLDIILKEMGFVGNWKEIKHITI